MRRRLVRADGAAPQRMLTKRDMTSTIATRPVLAGEIVTDRYLVMRRAGGAPGVGGAGEIENVTQVFQP
jgi:hypothetical protein